MPIDIQTTGYAQALARVREITSSLDPGASAAATAPPPVAAAGGSFAGQLQSALAPGATATAATTAAVPVAGDPAGTGARIAQIAAHELGVSEQPPGSNDGPRIAQYRTATAGSGVGPWCAYFASWVAQQAGVPIGPNGAGIGYVPTVKDWAQRTGRWIAAGSGAPQVGDLVTFDRNGDGVLDHIGVVSGVSSDGSIQTVEGNSSDKVSARSYGPNQYAGLVRLT